ncbi:MAG TPA: RNA 2',3'-cyclic phosphodiesterase [Candidatus Elarobacter sp.]
MTTCGATAATAATERARLFVAIPSTAAVRERCAAVADALRAAGYAAKWIPPANYHLTVAFLGSVGRERIAEIAAVARAVAEAHQPFTLRLDALGAFPNARRPRVIWLGSSGESLPFGALATAVRDVFGRLGFVFTDDAVPHLTLARADASVPLPAVPVAAIPLTVTELVLYESVQTGGSPRYDALERFPLATGARS